MDTTTGTVLPTHDATPSSSNKSAAGPRRCRRRGCVICLAATLGALLLLAATLAALFLTVLRVRDPTTRLVSARLVGLAPSLTPPRLNVTLLLTVAVHSPNPASFSFASGTARLRYHGALVGDAEVEPGRVPSRGDGTVEMAMTVMSDGFTPEMTARLVEDLEAGAVPLDAGARIPGKVAVFGVIRLRAVAYSDCHVVFGVPEMRVRSQECHDHTKL